MNVALRSAIRSISAVTDLVSQRVYAGNLDQATDFPAIAFNTDGMQGFGTFGACRTQKGMLEIGIAAKLESQIQAIADLLRDNLEKREIVASGYAVKFGTFQSGPLEMAPDAKWVYRPLQVQIFTTKLNE